MQDEGRVQDFKASQSNEKQLDSPAGALLQLHRFNLLPPQSPPLTLPEALSTSPPLSLTSMLLSLRWGAAAPRPSTPLTPVIHPAMKCSPPITSPATHPAMRCGCTWAL